MRVDQLQRARSRGNSRSQQGHPNTLPISLLTLLPSVQILLAFFCDYRHLLPRLIAQVGPQPAFYFFERHSFPLLVIQPLVPIDFPYPEIFCVLMTEIEPTHRCAGPHSEALCQANPGIPFGREQVEKNPLFSMVR